MAFPLYFLYNVKLDFGQVNLIVIKFTKGLHMSAETDFLTRIKTSLSLKHLCNKFITSSSAGYQKL